MQLNRVHNGHSAPPGAVQHQQHAPPPHHGVSFLHYEISLLAQRATEAAIKDVALVAWATAAVQQAAMTLWPAAEVFVYGSRSTGLSLPQSDLDIMIVMPTPESGPQMLSRDAAKDYVRMLYSGLAGQLNRTAWAKNVEAITNATMPVIHLFAQKPGAEASLSHSNTGSHELPLDISIVTGRHQGEKGIVLMQQLQAALPQLRPLFLAIKTLLLSHGLCCTYRGGLSSYGLVLLVSYFLQDPRNPANIGSNVCDMGVAYLQLLDFVGTQFDPVKEVVMLRGELSSLGSDVTNGVQHDSANSQNVSEGLNIRDPNDACNNPGRSATRFPYIQEICRCELQRQIQQINVQRQMQ